ncbi:helix-turn-helix transcriptional regulator [Streptomyces mirabilis]|uniref:helix-turn-helix transcriptional regulator n=1 Tax=Streptomyces mirabilis TaxID=68239 RepID=UPI0036915B10
MISDFSPAAVVWVLTRRTGRGRPEVERVVSLLPEPPLPHARVALDPCSENTVRELTADPLGAPPSPTLAALAAAAEGNDRLLIELLQGLSEENAFTFAGGTAEVTSTALPERVHRVVRLLPAEISSRCRLFIRLAALSGKGFELGAVAEPFGQPAGMLLPLVEEATDVGVIAGVGDRLVFTQPLFRRAVLESLPEPMRAGARGESVRPCEPARPAAGALAAQPRPAGLREIDRVIATLVSDGLTDSQIATRINRSPRTVSYHLRKLFGTLGVRSRSELVGTVGQRLWEAP